MSVLTDFFAATPDELAALAIEWGPAPPPPQAQKPKGGLFGFGKKQATPDAPLEPLGPTLPAVQATGILNTQLGALDQFVTGTPYETLEQDGVIDAIARDNGENGPWVFPVRSELRDALARLDDSRCSEIARRWGESEEIDATDPEDFAALEALLRGLTGLARSAIETNRDLYLWASL
jgi:hypothetical protein